MTVKQLRGKLSQFDDETRVVVYAEDGNPVLFEIDDVSIHTETPSRSGDGKAAFEFERDGSASWAFISVSAA
jgi:hypothetical protein